MVFALFTLIVLLVGYMKITGTTGSDIGLSILSKIKKMKGNSVDLSALEGKETPIMTHQSWTNLLKENVTTSGKVNYKGFIEEKDSLDLYLNALTNHPPSKNWDDSDKLAYWINAYNAFTVKLIINHYPLKSIKDLGGQYPMINSPWDIKFFKIGSVDFDLNTIEHEILRKKFDEPRIHFAINCASFSCPRLKNEAFEAAKLEEQLEEQTAFFINNTNKNTITKQTTKLSQIFNWFQSDFNENLPILPLLEKHHQAFQSKNKIEYLEYNWNLNE